MYAEERQSKIMELLKLNQKISNSELIERLNVSGTTIRTDLTELERNGKLVRTHGGAILKQENFLKEDPISLRVEKNAREKEEIARKARIKIEDGDSILLDSGTTAMELALLLYDAKNLTVITNDLPIALVLQKMSDIRLIVLGGAVRNSFECTVGGMAIRELSELNVDKAFITANALSIQKGASTPSLENAEIKRAMLKSGHKKYLLCDSSKLGAKTTCSFAHLTDFDAIIMDDTVQDEDRLEIEKLGMILI